MFQAVFARYGQFLKLRARLLTVLSLGVVPISLAYTVIRIVGDTPVQAAQSAVTTLFLLVSIWLLVRTRYESATTLIFVLIMPLSQLGFLLVALSGERDAQVLNYLFAVINACCTVVLIGAFAAKRYQIVLAAVANGTLLLVHTWLELSVGHLTVIHLTESWTYFLISVAFGIFNYTVFEQQNRLLRQQRELTEQVRRSELGKDRFLASVSHEMRNPLNAMIGATRMLQDGALDPTQREYVAQIATCNQLLSGMIANLLTLHQANANRLRVRLAQANLADTVRPVINLYRPRAESAGVELALRTDVAADRVVETDANFLRHIIMNLVDNAFKFTDRGSITLAYTLEANNTLCLRVEDTGIGMDAAQRARLFHRFVGFDGASQQGRAGFGIGLAVVNHMVERLGGQISVESTPLVGSCFEVLIPVTVIDADPATEPRRNDGPLRIFAADDDAINRLYMNHVLSQRGCTVTAFPDGAQLLEALKRGAAEVDLVILDIQMPVLDGFATAAAIRALPADMHADVPILALTGYALGDEEDQLAALGVSRTLVKPIEDEDLIRAIRDIARSRVAGGT